MPEHKGGGPQQLGMSNLGNTLGTTGIVSGPAVRFLFAGGDNITLSQSINGQSGTITIIGTSGGGGGFQGGVSTGGNTAGDTKTVASQIVFAGGNNITLSQSTNGASATITISGPALGAGLGETVGTVAGTDLLMTVNTDGVSIKHPNWLTAAAGGGFSAGVSTGGNTLGDTKTVASQVVFAGGNNITLSQSTDGASATVTISGPNAYSAGISTNGNTAGDTGYGTQRLVLIGGNNITLSGSTNAGSMSLTISAGAGGAGSNTLGMSNIGNTAGTTGVISGSALQYIFAGGNNITLSQSIMSNSATVTISGGASSNQVAGMSNIGNTSGTTGVVSAQGIHILFAGGNNITLSQSLMSNSATITISAAATGLAGFNTIGMSNLGNTTGTTGVLTQSQWQYLLAGGNNITLSQSLMSNSVTLTISGLPPGAQSMPFWQNMGVNGSATDAMAQTAITYNQLHVFQLDIGNNIFAGNMTVKTVLVDLTGSIATTVPSYTVSAYFGIYTINASTALSLLYSASVSFGTSGSSPGATSFSHQSLINGKRYLTMDGTLFTGISGFALSQALYYGAVLYRSSSTSATLQMYGAILGESGQRSGTMGAASVNNTYLGAMPYMGVYGTTTIGMPSSIGSQQLRKTANADIFIPHIMFNNIQASF